MAPGPGRALTSPDNTRRPWCPICQRFRPHYERVAARFNGPPSEPLLRVAQVDCVAQARLCTEFGVRGYPTLRFGHPADFTHGSHGADVDAQPREADVLLGWLNNKLGQCVVGGQVLAGEHSLYSRLCTATQAVDVGGACCEWRRRAAGGCDNARVPGAAGGGGHPRRGSSLAARAHGPQ